MNIEDLMKTLKKLNVKVCGTSEQFDGTPGGIWVSLEEGSLARYDDIDDDHFESSDINRAIEKAGYFLEPYDPGTAMIWPA